MCFAYVCTLSFPALSQKRDIWMKNEETKIPRTGAQQLNPPMVDEISTR